MKTFVYILAASVLATFLAPPAFGAKKMTPAMQNVAPISQTNNCEFIKTAYFEVSHPSKIHYYAAKNTANAGGDSYKILTAGEDDMGDYIAGLNMKITTTNIAIYKCKLPPKPSNATERKSSIPPEESKSPPKIDLRYLSESDDEDEEESEIPSYIAELKALAKLRDDGILTEDEFQKQKAKILEKE
jgi:hypothetical protein